MSEEGKCPEGYVDWTCSRGATFHIPVGATDVIGAPGPTNIPPDDRYQHQAWLVRRWRDRHYLSVPFIAIRVWYYEQTRDLRDDWGWRLSFKNAWGLAVGMAQCKQQHHYYLNELGFDFSLDAAEDEG